MQKTSIGRSAAGARSLGENQHKPRNTNDYYPTADTDVTVALLKSPSGVELAKRYNTVREPACGEGHMARVLQDQGFRVIGTDFVDRGCGWPVADWLKEDAGDRCRALVTNPPFTLPERINGQTAFLKKAVERNYEFVAMFAKSQFWHASSRLNLWNLWQPSAVYPLTWRPDFTGQGSPTMDCLWVVWDRKYEGYTCDYQPLKRPGKT